MTHTLQDILDRFSGTKSFGTLQKQLSSKQRIQLTGLHGSAPALLLQSLDTPFLCIESDEDAAGYLYNDLTALAGCEETSDIVFLPSLYKRGIRYGQRDGANEVLRSQVIDALRTGTLPRIIVTYPAALMELIPDAGTHDEQKKIIGVGDEVPRAPFREKLWDLGFEEVDYVYQPGQFAVRGSIIDIFSFAQEEAVRIDFFGDEVESIRTFDPETQLSHGSQDTVTILAAMDSASPTVSLLSIIPDEYTLYIPRWSFLSSTLEDLFTQPPVHPEDNIFTTLEEMQAMLQSPERVLKEIELHTILAQDLTLDREQKWTEVHFKQRPEPLFHKNFDILSQTLLDLQGKGYTTSIMSNQQSQIERLEAIFEDQGKGVTFSPILPTLHAGFIDDEMREALFSDHNIFERFHNYRLKSDGIRQRASALTLKEIKTFEYGDYIVHVNHGIGTFGGLFTVEKNGKPVEMVRLNYKGGDSLYVSIHSLHHISKYKSSDSEDPPTLNKLGTGAWDKIKERTKKKVKTIARDLIKLYAERLKVKGFAYSPDSYLQKELEASFQYEDTPDQETATAQVKADMEKPIPMDRLICGDVGFGKTEVAIRAAFKAVADSKQVAVMVPTTVLAYQHYRTFSKRLADFPCRVEYLSQSKTPKERKEILADLKEGKIDIIIGTHTLAGKSVEYKDLGLLIIDEEQKFGVAVKERLRKARTHVDTLTMTATPIPRTLQFSLMGARDLSNIQTPPPNRYPIRTEHTGFDLGVIAELINAELARDGQVFFIHNRVHNIHDIADDIRRVVPGVRIGIGHGQMPKKDLENVMLDFMSHKYDVLLATAIIENGIDVPNANTIIINDAQRFGLSDLHQLRGRVGRGNKKAYCILLTPPLRDLTPTAKRRIESITTFSELGSGIHIAMQDLDIRGAGNLLGSEQSGFIADLGYETYKRILEEAVLELKNEEFADLFDNDDEKVEEQTPQKDYVYETTLDTDMPAFFPADYVPGDNERISLYKELDSLSNQRELDDYLARLEDRFGPLPKEALELINVVQLRMLGKKAGLERIVLKNKILILTLVQDPNSRFFRSTTFRNILNNAGTVMVGKVHFKEENGTRSITIKNVKSLKEAYDLVLKLISRPGNI